VNNNLILCYLEEVIFNISPKVIELLTYERYIDGYTLDEVYDREHYDISEWLKIKEEYINTIYEKYSKDFYTNIKLNTITKGLQIGLDRNNFNLICFSYSNNFLDSYKKEFFDYIFNKKAKLVILEDKTNIGEYIKHNNLENFSLYIGNTNSNIINVVEEFSEIKKEYRAPNFKFNHTNKIEKLLLEEYIKNSNSSLNYYNPVY